MPIIRIPVSRRKNPKTSAPVDVHEAREIALCAENDGDIYRRRTTPIISNLAKKCAKGTYNAERAIDAFVYVVEDYIEKEGMRGVSASTKRLAATELRDYYLEEIQHEAEELTAKKAKGTKLRK